MQALKHNKGAVLPRPWPCSVYWESKHQLLVQVVHPEDPSARRARHLTLGGTSRISETDEIEGALVAHINDLRRGGHIASKDMVVMAASRLMPEFPGGKTDTAVMSWCGGFLQRHQMTLRRITYSGRLPHLDILLKREESAAEVYELALAHLHRSTADPEYSIPLQRGLHNMDQTAVSHSMVSRTKVEQVGAYVVPAVSCGDSNRVILAQHPTIFFNWPRMHTLCLKVCMVGQFVRRCSRSPAWMKPPCQFNQTPSLMSGQCSNGLRPLGMLRAQASHPHLR